ncbi:cbb3-type cytochrome c oxidase subunit 3 [bacterium]|nr:cbb3-type cytochrome c oxidase subunit 3 [bacterium]
MRQLLEQVGAHDTGGTFFIVLFVVLFTLILFSTFRKKNKPVFEKDSKLPLE